MIWNNYKSNLIQLLMNCISEKKASISEIILIIPNYQSLSEEWIISQMFLITQHQKKQKMYSKFKEFTIDFSTLFTISQRWIQSSLNELCCSTTWVDLFYQGENKWETENQNQHKLTSQGDPTSCSYVVGRGGATGRCLYYPGETLINDPAREEKGSNGAL